MKRVHYGNLAIDTTDEVGDLLIEITNAAANSRHFRGVSAGMGVSMQPFGVGRVEPVVIAGYLNGSDTSTDISLIVGSGMPIAIESTELTFDDPRHLEIVLDGLRATLAEYSDE